MADYEVHHEIVASNQDVDVRFYLSVDQGSYVAPHWHNSLEIIYMLEGSMHVKMEDREKEVQAGESERCGTDIFLSAQFQRDSFFQEHEE